MAQIMAQLPGIARSCPLAPPQLLHQDMSRLHRQRNACRPFQSTRGQAGRRTSARATTVASVQIPQRLNGTPMPRETRQFFYKDVAAAVKAAVAAGEQRIRLQCTIPETNNEQDVYRIGTVLEMVRELAVTLAQDGKRVKVCIQGPMGQGVFMGLPLSLSGVRRIMDQMDWGDADDFVTTGAVGADQVDDTDFYILVAPQNVVGGNLIMTALGEHVAAAEEKGKTVITLNGNLKDIPSHSGVMGIRGREDRMAFASSFKLAYHFRLLFLPGFTYPIMGALRYSYGQDWEVYKRTERKDPAFKKKVEEYQLVGEFPGSGPMPDGNQITTSFQPKAKQKPAGQWW